MGIRMMAVAIVLLAITGPALAGGDGNAGGSDFGRSASQHSATTRSAAGVMELMGGAGERIIIIDVRPKTDFAKSHLRGAINMVQFDKGALGADKAAKIVVYGASERDEAATKMIRAITGEGFTNVIWMRGGFAEWLNAQLPTVTQTATN